MPTYGSPGIGASIRMLRAARASARLSDRPSIRLSLMPGLDVEGVLGDDRPFLDAGHLHADAEVRQRLADALALGGEVHLRGADDSGAFGEQVERRAAPRRARPARAPRRRLRLPHLGEVRLLGLLELLVDGVRHRLGRSSATDRDRRRGTRRSVRAGCRPLATQDDRRLFVELAAARRADRARGPASPARAAAGRGSVPSAVRPASAGARRSARGLIGVLAILVSSRPARYAATRSPIVMLKYSSRPDDHEQDEHDPCAGHCRARR